MLEFLALASRSIGSSFIGCWTGVKSEFSFSEYAGLSFIMMSSWTLMLLCLRRYLDLGVVLSSWCRVVSSSITLFFWNRLICCFRECCFFKTSVIWPSSSISLFSLDCMTRLTYLSLRFDVIWGSSIVCRWRSPLPCNSEVGEVILLRIRWRCNCLSESIKRPGSSVSSKPLRAPIDFLWSRVYVCS